MKRFFLFAAALSITGIISTANVPAAFAQVPDAAPATAATAKISPEKKKSIEELITITGTVKAMRAAIAREIDTLEATNASIPKEVLTKMRTRFDERLPVLTERLIPVYDKNFTQEEIESFITFYKTPAGKKLAEKMPVTQQEGALIGAQWGREIGQEIEAEMMKAAGAGTAETPKSKPATKSFDKRPFKGNGKPVTTASGLKYEDMTVGTGATAVAGKTCVMHYTGTLPDGTKFDSSRDRNEPFPFPLGGGQVIRGWDEGVAGMKVGGRRKLTIPPALGYGAQGTPGGPIPPNATLIFDVELMEVK